MFRFKEAALAAATSLLCLSALAQTTPANPPASTNAPAKSTETPPVPGANSFTEAQAKDRMEKAGFTKVSNLKKDDQGIWRARAMQGGKQVNVALDFRGNVVQTR